MKNDERKKTRKHFSNILEKMTKHEMRKLRDSNEEIKHRGK